MDNEAREDFREYIKKNLHYKEGGVFDDHGFYNQPDGSFFDCEGFYFNANGYDEFGGYYDENGVYQEMEAEDDFAEDYDYEQEEVYKAYDKQMKIEPVLALVEAAAPGTVFEVLLTNVPHRSTEWQINHELAEWKITKFESINLKRDSSNRVIQSWIKTQDKETAKALLAMSGENFLGRYVHVEIPQLSIEDAMAKEITLENVLENEQDEDPEKSSAPMEEEKNPHGTKLPQKKEAKPQKEVSSTPKLQQTNPSESAHTALITSVQTQKPSDGTVTIPKLAANQSAWDIPLDLPPAPIIGKSTGMPKTSTGSSAPSKKKSQKTESKPNKRKKQNSTPITKRDILQFEFNFQSILYYNLIYIEIGLLQVLQTLFQHL